MSDEGSARPNVLYIFADQLGAHYLGCYGHEDVQTPNLDRLAEGAFRFTHAYTASPLCTPYRACLFSGRYPSQTGVVRNSQRLPHGETTLAAVFNDMGYATSYAGKWHLSGKPTAIRWVPPMERAGFADFIGWECLHVRHWDHVVFEDDPDHPTPMPGHETDGLAGLACDRLRRHAAGDRPFFMTVSFQAPHPVCEPPAEYHDLYRGRDLHYRPTVDFDTRFGGYGSHKVDIGVRDWTSAYFGEITQLDAAVGRILGTLSELGLDESTVVVFTSDHGDMAGCHGRFEKSVMYEEAIRIPLIVRMPGRASGEVRDELLSTVDFMPTLVELAGGATPSSAEGISYAPLLRGEAQSQAREDLFVEVADLGCVRRGAWKLVLKRDGSETRALHNLDEDPFEETNRVGDEGAHGVVSDLAEAYQSWRADIMTRRGDVDEASSVSPALRHLVDASS